MIAVSFFILTDFVEGALYNSDLDRIKEAGELKSLDEEQCLALSDYLVEIHSVIKNVPRLYVRRIRDLVGHGEGIFGLADCYPGGLGYFDEKFLFTLRKWLLSGVGGLNAMHIGCRKFTGIFTLGMLCLGRD